MFLDTFFSPSSLAKEHQKKADLSHESVEYSVLLALRTRLLGLQEEAPVNNSALAKKESWPLNTEGSFWDCIAHNLLLLLQSSVMEFKANASSQLMIQVKYKYIQNWSETITQDETSPCRPRLHLHIFTPSFKSLTDCMDSSCFCEQKGCWEGSCSSRDVVRSSVFDEGCFVTACEFMHVTSSPPSLILFPVTGRKTSLYYIPDSVHATQNASPAVCR